MLQEHLLVAIQRVVERFNINERRQGLGQTLQVPQSDSRLVIKAVTPLIVGVVADITWLIVVEETVRAIIDSQPKDRHVIGIHYAVSKAHRLPAGDQGCGTRHHVAEPENVLIGLVLPLRPVVTNNKICQLADFLRLAAIVKVFKMAKTGMALGNADEHGPLLHRLTRDGGIAGDNRQCAGSGNAQGMHRLGSQAFADGGAQHGAAIAHTRVWRESGAFQVPVHCLSIGKLLFAKQDPPPVSQLSGPDAELVPAVDLRQRLHARQQCFATKDASALFRGKERGRDCQFVCQRRVMPD